MNTTSPLIVLQDRELVRSRWQSRRFLVAQVTAPERERDRARSPVNLAFVLDRSGSMAGDKIQLAKQAVIEAIGRLDPRDRFAVVIYDDEIETVVLGTTADPVSRRAAIDRLQQVEARHTTDLGGGWMAGCEQVAVQMMEQGVNRCLLLSDGLANRGITDRAELARHAQELRARGVSTSTFGVGDHFDEILLQSMAQAGGGQFYDIAGAAQIPDYIESEVGETLEVVARHVSLAVEVPHGILVESLGAFPARHRQAQTIIDLGDLVSGQRIEVPLRLSFSVGEEGGTLPTTVSLRDDDGVFEGAVDHVTWRYADDHTNNTQSRNRTVDRTVAGVFASRARQRAVELNRRGEYRRARRVLEATAKRIRGYMGDDPELRRLVQELVRDQREFERVMPERARKERYASSAHHMSSRDADGKARRSGV